MHRPSPKIPSSLYSLKESIRDTSSIEDGGVVKRDPIEIVFCVSRCVFKDLLSRSETR